MSLHIFEDGTELQAVFVQPYVWLAYVDSEEDSIVGKGSNEQEAISNYWEQWNDAVMEAKYGWWERETD